MSSSSKDINGVIGEHYCLAELLLAGKEACLANGSNQAGWDIVVFDKNQPIRVQVKGYDYLSGNKGAVRGNYHEGEFDFLVIVVLNLSEKDKFTSLVIPREKLKARKEKLSGEPLIDQDKFIYYSHPELKGITNNSNSVQKYKYKNQTISISTLKDPEVYKKFDRYLSNFNSIKKVVITFKSRFHKNKEKLHTRNLPKIRHRKSQ